MSSYRLHPALVVLLCLGLLARDASAAYLVGHKVIAHSVLAKSALLAAKKTLIAVSAMTEVVLVVAAIQKGMILTPILLAGLTTNPLLVGPAMNGILVLKAGLGALVLQKGVLILGKTALLAKLALTRALLGKVLAAKVALLGWASRARDLGIDFGRSVVDLGSTLASRGMEFVRFVNRPHLVVETGDYGVPVAYTVQLRR